MAENNEEQYLDELLSSLMNSNTEEGEEGAGNAKQPEEGSAEESGTDRTDIAPELVLEDLPIDEPKEAKPAVEAASQQAAAEPTELNQDEIDALMNNALDKEESGTGEDIILEDVIPETNIQPAQLPEENPPEAGAANDILALEDFVGEGDMHAQEEAPHLSLNDFDTSELPSVDKEYEEPAENLLNLDGLLTKETGSGSAQPDVDDGLLDLLGEINKGIETGGDEGKKEKKKGLFARLFGRKKKSSEGETAASDKKEKKSKKAKKPKKSKRNKDEEARQETGAEEEEQIADDSAVSASAAVEEEEEAPKKEKKKKEKKPKPPKPAKPPKPKKPKKEKRPPKPSELVKVTPFTFVGIILFTAVIVAAVTIGSNILTYKVNISSAEAFFANGKYEQAFHSISGIEVKEKDKDTYYKIRTVMCVYADYSSYVSYSSVGMMVEALDSLLNGLDHYELYYAEAEKYEVLAQYNEIKDQIVSALAGYGISEADAAYYRQLESEEQYTEILQNIGGVKE